MGIGIMYIKQTPSSGPGHSKCSSFDEVAYQDGNPCFMNTEFFYDFIKKTLNVD